MEGLEASSFDGVMSPGFEAVIRELHKFMSPLLHFNRIGCIRSSSCLLMRLGIVGCTVTGGKMRDSLY